MIDLVGLRGSKMDGGEVADSLLSIMEGSTNEIPGKHVAEKKNKITCICISEGTPSEAVVHHLCRNSRSAGCAGRIPSSTDIPRSARYSYN